jgi:GDPmannose 4,6-dehydratase
MKRVVVGANGQDGRILFDRSLKECAVLGLDIGIVKQHLLEDLGPLRAIDLLDAVQIAALFERMSPDEAYYLAAHHHSSEEEPDPVTELRKCTDVHVIGLAHFLDAIRRYTPRCRLFFAGSSQMFGRPITLQQNETTPYAPRNPYGITKVAAAHLCAVYRERYGVHASVGILYNHESPHRGPRFVSQRIVQGARRAKSDPAYKLKLGSLSAVVDWGYAPDYVDAMIRIVSQPEPDDYVVATGEPHTVRDFVEIAFGCLGLDWRAHVEEDAALVRATQAVLVGDASKLRARTDWKPTMRFDQMVQGLVRAAASPPDPP